jgi:hypothetical protein
MLIAEQRIKLEPVFDKLPKYHTKILSGEFNAKVGREHHFKPTVGNESLHEINNYNGISKVGFATSKSLAVLVLCLHIVIFVNAVGRHMVA